MIDITKISGIGPFIKETKQLNDFNSRDLFKIESNNKAFLVVNKNTIELRTDNKLGKLLINKYESVMESRYFGCGGLEIVSSADQLEPAELEDLIRLSYNLTKNL
ncbi:hypothetical protein IKG06_01985 [Candidatus Saccharibacteria bacterium]|nr:hypothetical protein [Candidatus Saccharibacteria bacterium]